MNLTAVIMFTPLNGVHVKVLGMRRLNMATYRIYKIFVLLHINIGCSFKTGTRSNEWADLINTENFNTIL